MFVAPFLEVGHLGVLERNQRGKGAALWRPPWLPITLAPYLVAHYEHDVGALCSLNFGRRALGSLFRNQYFDRYNSCGYP